MASHNDPRKKRRFETVNQEILDAAIRHGAFLELHSRFLARRQLEFLQREVFPDVLGRLVSRLGRVRRRGGAMDWTAKNWLELVRGMNAQIRSGVTSLGGVLAEDLKRLAYSEAEWLRVMLGRVTPFEFEFNTPSRRLLQAVVSRDPINGKPLGEWFEDVERSTRQRILQQVRIGIASGDTTEQIVRRIRGRATNGFRDGVWNATRNQVETVARTATNAIANAAQRLTHQANKDVVTKVRWVSTLDARTCVQCAGLDGKVWPTDSAEYPPAHPHCRCVANTVLAGWEEFGLNASDLPEGTRASMNGQVPASLTFEDWLRGQPTDIQDRVLGKTKARLWRSGKVNIRDMSDANGRIMPLDEIRRREGLTEAEVSVRRT